MPRTVPRVWFSALDLRQGPAPGRAAGLMSRYRTPLRVLDSFSLGRETKPPVFSHCRMANSLGAVQMNETRNRVRSIFLHAVENYAPERWPAYLDEVCA